MHKDVIYIDVEDDITAIIGKVKDSGEKIVALVPPKRVGVLQSAVNLRLLERAAQQSHKHLVLISNNSALTALAAAAKIPVAKNLQSKPEIAEITALEVDDGDDMIDGASLPVGEHARAAEAASVATVSPAIDEAIKEDAAEASPRAMPPAPGRPLAKPRVKSGIKVPNFGSFRKKLVIGIGAGILLIVFLVWAVFFAPRATVIITARTIDSSSNVKVSLAPDVSTNASTATLKSVVQQVKKDLSADIDPTGTKEVGEKAAGTMTISRTSVSSNPLPVPAGTSFSNGNYTFVSTEGTTLSGTTVGPGGIVQDSATVRVQATAIGDEYNLSARAYQASVSGIGAQGSDMAGGSKRQVKVVSQDDVLKAVDQLTQQKTDDIKKQLQGQFGSDFIVIDQTFKSDHGDPQVTPAVGQEVPSGSKARLTLNVTYSLTGVTKADVGKFLDSYFNDRLDSKDEQRVYDNGLNGVTFTNLTTADSGFGANVVATAKIGPKINDQEIKNTAKGKRYGDIQSSIEAIQGVDDVDVKFWPFWVSSAPSDTNKISIDFKLNGKN